MLRDQITTAMKDALRAKDERTLGTTRLILAQMKSQDIDVRAKGKQDGIDDEAIMALLQSMIKQRRESVALYEKGGRADLATQEKDEIEVIKRFLPQQMDDAAMIAAIDKALRETGAASIKDMGKVMGALKKAYVGQMDFSQVGALVKARLGG